MRRSKKIFQLLLAVLLITFAPEAVKAQTCSGTTVLTAASGTFEDGSGGTNYGDNLNCKWRISVAGAGSIDLSFNRFRTEQFFDSVSIYDGSSESAPLIGVFSGISIPSAVRTTGQDMFIVFSTDGTVNFSGWEVTYTSFSRLCGDYSVGGSNPDYQTITMAVNDLRTRGVSCPVTFNIRSGTYTELLSIPNFQGSSQGNPVVFKSELNDSALVLIESATGMRNNSTLEFNASEYVSFEHLSVENSGGAAIEFIACSNIALRNCEFRGATLQTDSARFATLLFSQNDENDVSIRQSAVIGGSYGIYHKGTLSGIESSNIISDCSFQNQHLAAIYLKSQGNQLVERNRIDLAVNNPQGSYGIIIDLCNALSSKPGLIANNFIHCGGFYYTSGIRILNSNYQNLLYNSVHLSNAENTSRCFHATEINNNLEVQNSIFFNSGGGLAIAASPTTASTFDFNNIESSGNILGDYNGVKQNSLQDWRNASNGDANSISFDPLFTSNTDLHVVQSALNGAGTTHPNVSRDIDRDLRDLLNPDIGADEISVSKLTISCPSSRVVGNDPGKCEATITGLAANLQNASPGAKVTNDFNGTSLADGTYRVGTTAVEYLVVDGTSRDSCSFSVVVNDTELPGITCPGTISTVTDPAACSKVLTYATPAISDNCPSLVLSLVAGLGSGSAFNQGSNIEQYKVRDAAGNEVFCNFTIHIEDREDPSINCPSSIVRNADAGKCNAVVNYAAPVGADNCPNPATMLTGGIGSGGSFPVGNTIEKYRVFDGSGNLADCQFSITIQDSQAPSIQCPASATLSTTQDQCSVIHNYAVPVGADNCPSPITTLVNGFGSGAAFPVGLTKVTYSCVDASGNNTSCFFDVLVKDNQAPVVNCPSNIQTSNDAGNCGAVISYSVQFGDNCPGGTVIQHSGLPSGSSFNIGSSNLSFIGTDSQGNSGSCNFSIVVSDAEDPIINCPANIQIATPTSSCSLMVTYSSPQGMDNCPGALTIQTLGNASGSIFALGRWSQTFEVTDAVGRKNNCSFDIIVFDAEPPLLTCPSNIVKPADPLFCSSTVNFQLTSSDNCGTPTVILNSGQASGSSFSVGLTNQKFTATDQGGNSVQCTFNIEILDSQVPQINCPSNIVVTAPSGQSTAIATYNLPVVQDNCPGVGPPILLSGLTSGSVFNSGTTKVSYLVLDANGNTSSCDFNVTVNLVVSLIINCPPNQTRLNDPGSCFSNLTGLGAIVQNASGAEIVTNSFNGTSLADGIYLVGSNLVVYTVVDGGNSASCDFNVTVNDTEKPAIVCPNNLSLPTFSLSCSAIVNYNLPGFSDNCAGVALSLVSGLSSGSSFPEGLTSVVYKATDASGNEEQCSFVVSITDQTPPSLNCPVSTKYFLSSTFCLELVNYSIPIGADNCGLASLNLISGLGSGNLFPVGFTSERYQASDNNGNTADCSFTIEVVDTLSPTINCPRDINYANITNSCNALVNYPLPSFSDNCFGAQIVLSSGIGPGNLFSVGSHIEKYKVVDASGNESDCQFRVNVFDQQFPQIQCPANSQVNTGLNRCDANVNYTNPSSTDNCTGVTVKQQSGFASGALFPEGLTLMQFIASDASGNISSCSFNIEVLDKQAPTINCPANIVVNNDPGKMSAVVMYGQPSIFDNCPNVGSPVFVGIGSGGIFPVGKSIENYYVVDARGNRATCNFEVTVVFGNQLSIACPSNVVISNDPSQCSAILTSLSPQVINGSASAIIRNSYNGTSSANGVYLVGITLVNYTVSDGGQSDSCSFSVTVEDNEAPGITCSTAIVLNSDPGQCNAFVAYNPPVNGDNCSVPVVRLLSGNGSGTVFPVGSSLEQYEAEDAVGNKAVCGFIIEVIDNENPTVNCPANIIVNNDPGKSSAIVTYLSPTANDNCPNINSPSFSGIGSGGTFPLGLSNEVYTVSDASGNSSQCNFTVRVILGSILSINCPPDQTRSNDLGFCNANITGLQASPLNASPAALVTNSFKAGALADGRYPVGSTRVVYTVTDGVFMASCDFEVTVSDTEKPKIICPASITAFNDFGKTTALVNYNSPSVSDNCPGSQLQLLSGLISGSAFPNGRTLVRFSLTDASNNVSACSFEVYVIDTSQAPNLTTQGIPFLSVNGASFNLNATVINSGKSNAGASDFVVYLSTDTVIDHSDRDLAHIMLPALNQGATSPASISMNLDTMPLNLPIGTYFIAYKIDDGNLILEGHEDDNEVVFKASAMQIVLSTRNIEISGKSNTINLKKIAKVDYKYDLGAGIVNWKSGNNGKYRFVIPYNSNIDIRPTKNNDSIVANGVDAMDLALMSDHILNKKRFSTPYQILAADVSQNELISVHDINWIQSLILGKSASFPGSKLWTFVPTDYIFNTPLQPWNPDTSRIYLAQKTSLYNRDFTGIKLGDVNDSRDQNVPFRPLDTLEFRLPRINALPGSIVHMPISISAVNELKALQLQLSWDNSQLEFISLTPMAIDPKFETYKSDISLLWFTPNSSVNFSENTQLFSMNFRVLPSIKKETKLELRENITPLKSYDTEGRRIVNRFVGGSVGLATGINEIYAESEWNIRPNPNAGSFTLEREASNNSSQLKAIEIKDALGRTVYHKRMEARNISGISISFNLDELAAGVYSVLIHAAKNTEIDRLIISK